MGRGELLHDGTGDGTDPDFPEYFKEIAHHLIGVGNSPRSGGAFA
jgi:hypothetical protein